VKYREHPASAEVIRHVATAMQPSAVSTAATCFYFIGLGRSDPSLNMSKGSRLVCDAIASLRSPVSIVSCVPSYGVFLNILLLSVNS